MRTTLAALVTLAGAASAIAEDAATSRFSPLRSIDINPYGPTPPWTPGHSGAPTHRVSPLLGNPNPWAPFIDANDFHEGFEFEGYTPHISLSALADLAPLAGQIAPNGNAWKSVSDVRHHSGIVDNAIAQTGVTSDGMGGFNPPGSGYFGPPGGPDPTGARSQFVANPRGSVWDLSPVAFNTSFEWVARLDHVFYMPTPDLPVITTIDAYLDSNETHVWLRPVSTPEQLIVNNIFMGGYDVNADFTGLVSAENLIDRPIVLHRQEHFELPEFYVTQHQIKSREWFTIGIRQTTNSHSLWIRDSETIGAYGFVDESAAMFPGDTNAPDDGVIPFESEIFERDWVQIFPGLFDDPATPLKEGSGRAINQFMQDATVFRDATGSPAGLIPFAYGIEEIQVVGGFDPAPELVPTYRAKDWYVDNYTVMGEPWCPDDIVETIPRAIDGADLAMLLADWGPTTTYAQRTDLNDDNTVNGADLALLLARWGAACVNNQWVTP